MFGPSAGALSNYFSFFLPALLSALFISLPFLFPALFPLAWIALVPLLGILGPGTTLRRAFLYGWLIGVLTSLIGFYWVPDTIRVFGGFPYVLSVIIFFVFAAYSALPMAVFALLVRVCGLGPLHLVPALFWVAIEFWYPHLFPWHMANSQSNLLTLIQSADLVGPYGTSFLVVWANAVIYGLLYARNRKSIAAIGPPAALAAALVAALLYGHIRISTVSDEMAKAPTLPLAAIQGNIDIELKWDPDQWKNNLKTYQELTREAQGASLVIWPETAVEPWVPEGLSMLPPELVPPLDSGGSYFIFGARSFRGNPSTPSFKAFNSAFLSDASGRILGRYHKQVLLAFGEYIPLAALLARLPGVPDLGEAFTAGDGPRTLDLPGGIRIAPLICYEDLMPALARRFVAERKTDLLVNLTNDAWYGRTAAPWQHARLSQLRAIETRRTLVRATNTGLTGVIDPTGEMVRTLPIFTPGKLTVQAKILRGETFYVRFGDWFAWVATILSLVVLGRPGNYKAPTSL